MSVDYRQFIAATLEAAGQTAKSYSGKVSGSVKTGDNNQVLTEADVVIGKQIVLAIRAAYPDHNVIDEEAGVVNNGSDYTWVVDPIDGTSNFAAGLPDYGIMIGLLQHDEPVAGGIITPAHGRLYLAGKGQGATCNDVPIHVTTELSLSNVLISYGIDGHQEDTARTYNECGVMADVILACRNIRNSGCEAIDPMYVADGRYGGRINMTSKIWDNVAPHIIAVEAGAIWTTANGQPVSYASALARVSDNFTSCLGAPAIHEQLQAVIKDRL